jgi:hypothetical protein
MISLLPPEILLNVISFLKPMELERNQRVCKLWKELINSSPSLWNQGPKLNLNKVRVFKGKFITWSQKIPTRRIYFHVYTEFFQNDRVVGEYGYRLTNALNFRFLRKIATAQLPNLARLNLSKLFNPVTRVVIKNKTYLVIRYRDNLLGKAFFEVIQKCNYPQGEDHKSGKVGTLANPDYRRMFSNYDIVKHAEPVQFCDLQFLGFYQYESLWRLFRKFPVGNPVSLGVKTAQAGKVFHHGAFPPEYEKLLLEGKRILPDGRSRIELV